MDSETFVKKALPKIKKLIVKTLYNKHKLTQTEIANKLYISQASVSYYINDLRAIGSFEMNEKIVKSIEIFADRITNEKISKKDLEEFYEEIRNSI
ncbi:MAG: winged helix-turn-helix transcriptional regulator [Candidatus Aenigmarchaeota archaeon]|nr:winged helix-turn-helix transcriptional regulator [Candidatus Aenigmarchaeota archaeon]MDW8149708.1 winged helix-turn-helix transcriptional regulator [Candidatus Aenigmarchaeota archaeon]